MERLTCDLVLIESETCKERKTVTFPKGTIVEACSKQDTDPLVRECFSRAAEFARAKIPKILHVRKVGGIPRLLERRFFD